MRSSRGKSRWGGGSSKRIQFSHSYEDIISVENLLAAWEEFVRGKRKKKDVQEFQYRLMDNILALHRDLVAGTYKHGGYDHFKISDPKPRDIHKATVRDRLLHHALYRKLYPFFDHIFIADSYSCRKGKGTHRAMNRFRQFAFTVSKNHTRTCWVLKCDIRKFFASIDQNILLNIVAKYIPDACVVSLIAEIVGSFSSLVYPVRSAELNKGLPLGNLTSQLLVNTYMNEFDQFVKHKLKVKYYTRYADDFVILSHDRAFLASIERCIALFLRDHLKLELHPDKVFIKTLASGVDFLGWVHFPDHRVLRTSTKRRMFRGIRARQGKEEMAQSYFGLMSHGNTKKLRRNVEDELREV
ncbi:MAG: reverse transcriptase/maturase family protein [bacterium]|nr:reverse transcriptase/maturase family protein [bacterium]